MKYNRKEAFRFTFSPPIPGIFSITLINNAVNKSRNGKMTVLDLSSGGIKFNSYLELPEGKELELMVTFKINEDDLDLHGKIMWKKKMMDSYLYGLALNEKGGQKDKIIEELKLYRKKMPAVR